MFQKYHKDSILRWLFYDSSSDSQITKVKLDKMKRENPSRVSK